MMQSREMKLLEKERQMKEKEAEIESRETAAEEKNLKAAQQIREAKALTKAANVRQSAGKAQGRNPQIGTASTFTGAGARESGLNDEKPPETTDASQRDGSIEDLNSPLQSPDGVVTTTANRALAAQMNTSGPHNLRSAQNNRYSMPQNTMASSKFAKKQPLGASSNVLASADKNRHSTLLSINTANKSQP